MPFVEHNDIIQHFSARASDPTLRRAVLHGDWTLVRFGFSPVDLRRLVSNEQANRGNESTAAIGNPVKMFTHSNTFVNRSRANTAARADRDGLPDARNTPAEAVPMRPQTQHGHTSLADRLTTVPRSVTPAAVVAGSKRNGKTKAANAA